MIVKIEGRCAKRKLIGYTDHAINQTKTNVVQIMDHELVGRVIQHKDKVLTVYHS